MNFTELTEDNYVLFAIKYYDNPSAVTKEDFLDDLRRFKYIKRLINKYLKNGEVKLHLLLNHIIIVYNVFNEAATPLLFYKMDKEYRRQRQMCIRDSTYADFTTATLAYSGLAGDTLDGYKYRVKVTTSKGATEVISNGAATLTFGS